MAIDVVSALSADKLLPLLAERLSKPLGDPFSPDIVVVPGIGIADWIQEQLSLKFGARGIVANTKFWLPNEFNAIVSASADHGVKKPDATSLQWVIFEHLSNKAAEGIEPAPGFMLAKRKLSFAKRVAELFDTYSVHRPEMILDWNAGKDTDGATPLSDHQKWQPNLWRELQSLISASESPSKSKATSLIEADWQRGRVTFFGLESFSRAKVQLLKDVRDHRDLQILHLSPIDGVIPNFLTEDFIVGDRRRGQDLTTRVSNPLLRSWSRTALECAALLSTVANTAKSIPTVHPETVLGALQKSLAQDTILVSEEKSEDLLKQSDGSVQVHLCHGATRQVEVLRDALLHIMKADPSIRPRDILVLCTDVEKYSSLIEPVMGAGLGSDLKKLPVSIVDRSNATATPVAVAIDTVLALAVGRCSVMEVLEAISLEPIRLKFGFDEDELQAISGWVNQLNVKWGIDSQHRTAWKYSSEFEDGTWQLAIDRLTAGMMIQSESIEEHFPSVAAFDDLSGSNIETVGKLFAFHHALKVVQQFAKTAHVASEWAASLGNVIDTFIAVPHDEKKHVIDAYRTVSQLSSAAAVAPTAQFSLPEFRQHVADSLPAVRGSALKWADVVRVASPNRLRGVSTRVVALLGFDDDAFRGRNSSGDDILASDPRIGERDLRADERLGLLTTIHSASEHLVITCNGHDVNKNTVIPLAVPMEELKDAIALAISTIPKASRSNKPVLINHSRQLADRANVALDSDAPEKNVQSLIGDGNAWTFDHAAVGVVAQIANLAISGGQDGAEFGYPILPPPIEKEIRTEVELKDFHEAIRRPVDVYINQRLGVVLPGDDEASENELPLWPNPLAYSEIGRELLSAIQNGETADEWKNRKHLSGGLPLGQLAETVWAQIEDEVGAMIDAAGLLLAQKPIPTAVSLALVDEELETIGGGKLRVIDSVSVNGDSVLAMNFSTWNRRMRVLPWLQIAALTLEHPETVWKAVIIAKAPKVKSAAKEPAPQALFAREEFVIAGDNADERQDSALRILEFANSIRTRARRVPLPLFERSSWILDKSVTDQKSALATDLKRPSHVLVFGERELDVFKIESLLEDVDKDLSNRSSRFEAYSTWLSEIWMGTVRVLEDAEPKKKSAGVKKKANIDNSEGTDTEVVG
jgi:exodeoxyribonuclease V gamma subunit